MKNFWAYFKSLNMNSGNPRNMGMRIWDIYIAMGVMMLYGILMGNLGSNSMPFSVILGSMLLAATCAVFVGSRIRPSLYHLLPITTARKIVYFFLSCILYFVIILVALFLTAAATSLIVALIALAASGEWILVVEETSAEAVPDICAQGYGISAACLTAASGAVLSASTIERRLWRNILILATPVIIFIPLKIYAILSGIGGGNLFISFDINPFGWVLLLIYSVAAAALLALGVYRTVLYLRPKRF